MNFGDKDHVEAIRDMTRPRDAEEQRLEEDSQRIQTHTLLKPGECGMEHHDDVEGFSCPVCDQGLGICAACGAAESELSKMSCEDRQKGLALLREQGKDQL